MHIERARLLFDDDGEQVVESFRIGRGLESLLRHEDRDVWNTLAALARSIAPHGSGRLRQKEVACNVCAAAPRDRDDRRAVGHAGIRVVDNKGASRGQGLGNQLLLPPLRLPVVAHGVLADHVVGGGKAFAVKGRLAGRRQPDQDYALHVSVARG